MAIFRFIRTPILIMWSLIIVVYIIRSPLHTLFNPPSVNLPDMYYEHLHTDVLREYGLVTHISDGDTITIDESYDVRLLGIDTPELAHPEIYIREECYGKDASLRLKQLLTNTYVYLMPGVKDEDHYGRKLRFVFVADTKHKGRFLFVNAYMVGEGFARAYALEQDQPYKAEMFAFQLQAKSRAQGLWKTCDREMFRW